MCKTQEVKFVATGLHLFPYKSLLQMHMVISTFVDDLYTVEDVLSHLRARHHVLPHRAKNKFAILANTTQNSVQCNHVGAFQHVSWSLIFGLPLLWCLDMVQNLPSLQIATALNINKVNINAPLRRLSHPVIITSHLRRWQGFPSEDLSFGFGTGPKSFSGPRPPLERVDPWIVAFFFVCLQTS